MSPVTAEIPATHGAESDPTHWFESVPTPNAWVAATVAKCRTEGGPRDSSECLDDRARDLALDLAADALDTALALWGGPDEQAPLVAALGAMDSGLRAWRKAGCDALHPANEPRERSENARLCELHVGARWRRELATLRTRALDPGYVRSAPAPERTCRCSALQRRWQRRAGGVATLVIRQDLDGDGRGDVLEAESSAGSGFELTRIDVELTGAARSLRIEHERSYSAMVSVLPAVAPLGEPWADGLRVIVADVLFPAVCDRADPSLQALMEPAGAIRWHAGEPSAPESYALFYSALPPIPEVAVHDRGRPGWLDYAGHTHGGSDDQVVFKDQARSRTMRLRTTRHGVVLVDEARLRYAWVYVFPGRPGHKLRWASIESASFGVSAAQVRLAPPLDDPEAVELVNLGPFHQTEAGVLHGRRIRGSVLRSVQLSECQAEPGPYRLACAEEGAMRANEELDAVNLRWLAEARRSEERGEVSRAQAAQAAWQQYLDAHCDAFVGEHPGAGLGWAGSRALCVEAMTRARVADLLEMVPGR